jgi:hypothetical protein
MVMPESLIFGKYWVFELGMVGLMLERSSISNLSGRCSEVSSMAHQACLIIFECEKSHEHWVKEEKSQMRLFAERLIFRQQGRFRGLDSCRGYYSVDWISGNHQPRSATYLPPLLPTYANIYRSIDLLYSVTESSCSTDIFQFNTRRFLLFFFVPMAALIPGV